MSIKKLGRKELKEIIATLDGFINETSKEPDKETGVEVERYPEITTLESPSPSAPNFRAFFPSRLDRPDIPHNPKGFEDGVSKEYYTHDIEIRNQTSQNTYSILTLWILCFVLLLSVHALGKIVWDTTVFSERILALLISSTTGGFIYLYQLIVKSVFQRQITPPFVGERHRASVIETDRETPHPDQITNDISGKEQKG